MPASGLPGWLTASPRVPSRLDAMHRHVARIVVGGEQILAGFVDAGMDGARRQRLRLAVRLQGARRRIDAECAGEMLVAGEPRPAVARHDIEISFRRMRPGILNVGGKRHRAALLQRGVGNVDVEQRQLRSDAGVEDGLGCHWPRLSGLSRRDQWSLRSCLPPHFDKLATGSCSEGHMRLRDKVAIVVGAGQSPGEGMGNGRATVLRFVQEGAKVLAVDSNLASAEETVAMARQPGGECVAFEADVTKETTLAAMVEAARRALGPHRRAALQCRCEHRRRRRAARRDHRGGVRPHRRHQPARRHHGLQARRAGDARAALRLHHHDFVGGGLGAVSQRGLQGDQGRA